MDEFGLIDTYFKPLAKSFPGSLNLTDDAAVMAIPPGCELVITKDAISQGMHFIGNEDAALIAKKLLRVNLSDLAAMGAKPHCYFLALILPSAAQEQWVKRFAEGLAEDQKQFGIHLAGGDTIATHGTLSFSITALGSVPAGKALKRSGAKPGDQIYVSGTLGDSALGLLSLRGEAEAIQQKRRGRDMVTMVPPTRHAGLPRCARNDELINRYLLPQPRVALGPKLLGIANSCMDISDGLVQDLGHICRASGVGAVVQRDRLSLSAPARKMIEENPALWDKVLSGGDDYELLFTAAAGKEAEIHKLAQELGLPITAIGEMRKGGGVQVLDEAGKIIDINRGGFQHF